jgi:Fe-S-cluster containining protein
MKIITDLEEIKKRAAMKERENREFADYLKHCDIPAEEIETIVQKLADEVSSQIDCLACGNCCRASRPSLTNHDIKRLAKHHGISRVEFKEKHITNDPKTGEKIFRDHPCPFQSGNSCTVYAARADACRSFPHLNRHEFSDRLQHIVSFCPVCPLIYNVYEMLKDKIRPIHKDPDGHQRKPA